MPPGSWRPPVSFCISDSACALTLARASLNAATIRSSSTSVSAGSTTALSIFTRFSGSMAFVFLHALWFAVWMAWNTGRVPGLRPFDPYPFGLLTMIVSLEAIFLSTFVLISQNREQQVSAVRDEIETQIALYQEQELTQVLRIVHRIEKHLGLGDEDEAMVCAMEQFVDSDNLFRQIEAMVARKA